MIARFGTVLNPFPLIRSSRRLADCGTRRVPLVGVSSGAAPALAAESPEGRDDSEPPSGPQSFRAFHFVKLVVPGGVL